jgi:L-amino acid N-acyltransferase YncA
MIRDATGQDAAGICAVYNPYVLGTTITFEEEAVSVEAMSGRIAEITASFPWLVWEENGAVKGYAYATQWRARSAYRFSVEATVYLDQGMLGRGLGTVLYRELLARLKEKGIHCVMGGIALPNQPSVALHEKLGFKKIAHFEQIGWKFNQWIDVGYWQLNLARP